MKTQAEFEKLLDEFFRAARQAGILPAEDLAKARKDLIDAFMEARK